MMFVPTLKYLRAVCWLAFLVINLSLAGCAVMTGKHQSLNCNTCHEGKPKKGVASLKSPGNPSNTCKECHRYNKDSDHHPSKVTRKTPFTGSAFKLYGNKMECLTCHKMHQGDDSKGGGRYSLVGGPYNNRRDICSRCHNMDKMAHINPHSSKMKYKKSGHRRVCFLCHEAPSKGNSNSGKSLELKASDIFLCWQCHRPMEVMEGVDMLQEHLLLNTESKLPADNLEFNLAAAAKEETVEDQILYLDSFKRVTCYTCHEPHEPFDPAIRKGVEGRIKPRTAKLCSTCHKM